MDPPEKFFGDEIVFGVIRFDDVADVQPVIGDPLPADVIGTHGVDEPEG